MTRTEVEEVLLEIIADIDEEADFDALDPDKPLRDQLELDSMDFLDIVMELRKRYKLFCNLRPARIFPGLDSHGQNFNAEKSLSGDYSRVLRKARESPLIGGLRWTDTHS